MRLAGWYGILIGVFMVAQWSLSLAAGGVPELQTEPYRIYFHLAAEFSTALALFAGGLALLKHWRWGLSIYLVAAGMLLYSVIVSPGYFAQLGQWAMVGMFAVLLALTMWTISEVARAQSAERTVLSKTE
jgi:hypothetical protein